MAGKGVQAAAGQPPARTARGGSPSAKGKPKARRYKKTFYLSELAVQRIGVAAKMTHRRESDVVDELATQSLKRFVVTDREKPAAEGEGLAVVGSIEAA